MDWERNLFTDTHGRRRRCQIEFLRLCYNIILSKLGSVAAFLTSRHVPFTCADVFSCRKTVGLLRRLVSGYGCLRRTINLTRHDVATVHAALCDLLRRKFCKGLPFTSFGLLMACRWLSFARGAEEDLGTYRVLDIGMMVRLLSEKFRVLCIVLRSLQ